jgi:hypothetical protein
MCNLNNACQHSPCLFHLQRKREASTFSGILLWSVRYIAYWRVCVHHHQQVSRDVQSVTGYCHPSIVHPVFVDVYRDHFLSVKWPKSEANPSLPPRSSVKLTSITHTSTLSCVQVQFPLRLYYSRPYSSANMYSKVVFIHFPQINFWILSSRHVCIMQALQAKNTVSIANHIIMFTSLDFLCRRFSVLLWHEFGVFTVMVDILCAPLLSSRGPALVLINGCNVM